MREHSTAHLANVTRQHLAVVASIVLLTRLQCIAAVSLPILRAQLVGQQQQCVGIAASTHAATLCVPLNAPDVQLRSSAKVQQLQRSYPPSVGRPMQK